MASIKTRFINTSKVSMFHRRKRRRLFTEVIREKTTSLFYSFIQEASSNLLLNLLRTPEDFLEHITMCVLFFISYFVPPISSHRYGASSLFSSTYGNEATESAGFSLRGWEQLPEIIAAGSPGAFLVVSSH
jgi:hypothetical protein